MISHLLPLKHPGITTGFLSRLLGKDEVAGSNPAISSMTLKHVVSMGLGVFLLLILIVKS